ncbi:MAG: 23S rRNA (adenine(2503)-C(2))-methyltransferase RlmN [Sphaerobacteraceae bacterium]|nr:MAG: 23S rRNA (adenine(2503)-C(2))-methyltransferase RlmN [Sphaerobacteraceae bacterium]
MTSDDPTIINQEPATPVRVRRGTPQTFYDLTLDELTEKLGESGHPAYRARQLYHWAYQQLAPDYDTMTVLPKALRDDLANELPLTQLEPVQEIQTDDGETLKLLFRTHDGNHIETVLMFYPDRVTVCVSCQIGCAVGCSFCATGMMGLTRNLSTGEMVGQVVAAARRTQELDRQLTNIVMMGMGEPFQNYDSTMRMARILNDPEGMKFGARRITVSTSGLVPFIDRLAADPLQVKLAISLHAPTDQQRDTLVPLNRRWNVQELISACRRYVDTTGRRISFEYCLIRDVNDSEKTARELARLLKGLLCHVNIIPLNPTPAEPSYERPTEDQIKRFADIVDDSGIPTSVRYSRGVDIAAACGQLRIEHEGGTEPATT